MNPATESSARHFSIGPMIVGSSSFETVPTMHTFAYTLKQSKRAKRLRITITTEREVIVTIPERMPIRYAENFIKEKSSWIESSLEKIKKKVAKRAPSVLPKSSKRDFTAQKERALKLATQKLDQWNALYRFNWNNVTIRNTSTRWGSCSKQGNLSFNYKLVYLSEALLDYLIVHELCHLKEMNHSPKFWKLVEQSIPDYTVKRKELKYI